ncbi:MAG: hypothetical protein AVW05_01100 [Hadesarchaea archaeon DG-33]|nr:MAG: hypothetical protein AVW05_01100 [Hadesarchaea archaeon DG-33]
MPAEEGAKLIIDDILKEAKKKAAEVIQTAEREAATMRDAARLGAKEEEEHKLKEARVRGKQVYEEVMAEGRMKAKKEMLQKKEGLIGDVFKEAEEKLRAQVASKRYKEDIARIALSACRKLGSGDVVVRANRRDLKLLESFKEQMARELSGGEKTVNISFGEPIQAIGGVRVGTPDGKVEIDDTFEGRMRREFEVIRVKVAKVLFEGFG